MADATAIRRAPTIAIDPRLSHLQSLSLAQQCGTSIGHDIVVSQIGWKVVHLLRRSESRRASKALTDVNQQQGHHLE